jgi:hypothetical protein
MVEVKLELVCECGGFVAEFERFSNAQDSGLIGDNLYTFYGCERCGQNYLRAVERDKNDNLPKTGEFKKIDENKVRVMMQLGEIVRKYS